MMKTVKEHLKDRGFDSEKAVDKGFSTIDGTMLCEDITVNQTNVIHPLHGNCLCVEGTALVPFSDGTLKPYPFGWDKSLESSITLYFKKEDS